VSPVEIHSSTPLHQPERKQKVGLAKLRKRCLPGDKFLALSYQMRPKELRPDECVVQKRPGGSDASLDDGKFVHAELSSTTPGCFLMGKEPITPPKPQPVEPRKHPQSDPQPYEDPVKEPPHDPPDERPLIDPIPPGQDQPRM
jgi:hypothetical protein